MGRVPAILRPMKPQRPHSIFALVALLACLSVLGSGCSGGKTPQPTDDNPVIVTVEVVPAAAAPGESVTLVWRFAMAEDWHLYWTGRNDSGYPPRIDLELPDGWVAGGLQWPAPERYVAEGDILDHVYFDELVLVQRVGAPEEAPVGSKVIIKADVQWLGCKEMCLPGKTALTIPVEVQSHVEISEPNNASTAMDRLPVSLPDHTLETMWDGSTFHLHHPRASRLTFMPTEDCGRMVDLLNDGQGDRLALRFKPKSGTVGPVRGLITIEQDGAETRTYRIDFPAAVYEAASTGG